MRGCGSPCSPRCTRPASRWTPTGSPSRSTGRARSSSSSRPPATGCGSCGSVPERRSRLDGTAGGRGPARELPRARGTRRRRAPVPQDPPVHVLRRARALRGRRRARRRSSIDGVRCSLFVCYDLRFADEFWSLAPVTDCYVVPANWPAKRRDHWRTLLRARAIENQAYVVGVEPRRAAVAVSSTQATAR